MDNKEEGVSPSDLSLIEEISIGNREAFKIIYNRYVRQAFTFLFRITKNSNVAEEITNDVMFEVWKGAGMFKRKSSVLTWILGIAHNKAMNELRKKSPELIDPEEFSRHAAPDSAVEETILKKDIQERITMALENLSAEHRAVLELTFYQGLSYQEIALVMDCPVNTVKTRMFYAKGKLKGHLKKLGITDEDI